MSRKTARRLLWLAGVLLLPLPYLVVSEGSVPVLRFAFLACVSSAYALWVDGGGVAWMLSGLLWAHAALYAAICWAGAATLAWALPARVLRVAVPAAIAAGAAAALWLAPYHTPFAAESARSGWLGLLQ